MSEPVYTYVKGQGWVVLPPNLATSHETLITYSLELRKPNPGELCCWTDPPWDVEKWKAWLADNRPFPYEYLKSDLSNPRAVNWCTFIPVTGGT